MDSGGFVSVRQIEATKSEISKICFSWSLEFLGRLSVCFEIFLRLEEEREKRIVFAVGVFAKS